MKSRTKAIVYSCCYASEGSACVLGRQLAGSGGDNPVRDGFVLKMNCKLKRLHGI